MLLRLAFVLSITFTVFGNCLYAQEGFVITKAFDEKLKKFGLEYLEPTKMYLHPIPHKDEYDEYDLVLYADNQEIEVRYIFRDDSSPISLAAMPHLEFYRSIIDFASNENESNQIMIQDIHPDEAAKNYNADWCLQADFTPKESVSPKPNGRILGIYKEETGLIFCMIFYDQELPTYFSLPVKFKHKSVLKNN